MSDKNLIKVFNLNPKEKAIKSNYISYYQR